MARTFRGAFTLVELLVVIGIIALLIAILLPSLSRARQSAQAVACASNLRQLGLAMVNYTTDHKGQLPYSFIDRGTVPSKNRVSWDDCLNRYLGGTFTDAQILDDRPTVGPAVLACPTDPIERGLTPLGQRTRSYSTSGGFVFGSFSSLSVNFYGAFMRAPIPGGPALGPSDPLPAGFRSFKLTELRPSAEVFLLVEQPAVQNILGHITLADCRSVTAQYAEVPAYHGAKFNYLYADGHVQGLKPESTVGTGTLASPRGAWSRAEGD